MTQPDLNTLIADYTVLYQKSRAFHWNVTGPHFFHLHAEFENLYLETADRIDALAERAAGIHLKPISSLKEVLATARLREERGDPSATEMVRALVEDLDLLNKDLRRTSEVAVTGGDQTTADLLDDFTNAQEKTLWMFRSFLQ